jgi:hypothetical protein
MIFAAENGKIDGFIAENTYVSAALWEGAKIASVDEPIDRTEAGYIFQKNYRHKSTLLCYNSSK